MSIVEEVLGHLDMLFVDNGKTLSMDDGNPMESEKAMNVFMDVRL